MGNSPRLYLKLVLVTLFWGGTFIAGRIASAALAPAPGAFGRFVVAALFLVAVLWSRRGGWPKLDRGQWGLILAGGLTGIVLYNLFFFSGLRLIEANRASLIVALNPIMIMLSAGLLGMERLTGRRLLGALIALAGVAVVLTRGDFSALGGSIGLGEVLIFGCVFSWSAYTLIGRKLVGALSPLVVTTYSVLAGCAGLFFLAAPDLGQFRTAPLEVWLAIAFLGIFGTGLGFVWYYDGVKAIGPSRAGVFINLVPGWAVLLSVLLLGERIVPATLIGGVVIVAGVTLANLPPRRDRLEGAA
jgi:drug/metabolite transporter (DMT)-like permease